MNLMRGIDLRKIAQETNGASGAEAKVRMNVQIRNNKIFTSIRYGQFYCMACGIMKLLQPN